MDEDDRTKDDRVSLEGLRAVEALRALLAVDPDAPPVDADGKPQPEPAEGYARDK